jgi:O-antigen ligase
MKTPDRTDATHGDASILAEKLEHLSRLPAQIWLRPTADALAAAVAVSLPWSTSITGILIVLWLVALVPTFDAASIRRELLSSAGGLPVLLWMVGAAGMLWAPVSLSERIGGLSGFHKLLLIPLLFAQFRRSGSGSWVILGLVGSSGVLLAISWGLALAPGLAWRGKEVIGVPVKDYVLQSELFAICAFGLIGQAGCTWHARPKIALLLVLTASLFIANILYVETARTTLIIVLVLLALFGYWQFRLKGAAAALVVAAVLFGVGWATSPYLRDRVSQAIVDLHSYDSSPLNNPVGQRLEYWRKSLTFIAQAPVLGHGTGSIPALFRREAGRQMHPAAPTANPHNQLLAVALQLGVFGSIILIAMWASHILLFREHTMIAWLGLVIVVQNVVACLFNSHLFDFTQGWLYVLSIGTLGGMALRASPGS